MSRLTSFEKHAKTPGKATWLPEGTCPKVMDVYGSDAVYKAVDLARTVARTHFPVEKILCLDSIL